MNPQYSFWADCLSKFQSASDPIRALGILALAATVLGVTWLVMRAAVEIAKIGQQARAGWKRAPRFPEAFAPFIESAAVIPGLDPGTHALIHATEERGWPGQARP